MHPDSGSRSVYWKLSLHIMHLIKKLSTSSERVVRLVVPLMCPLWHLSVVLKTII